MIEEGVTKLGTTRRPGTSTAFVDAANGEILLKVSSNGEGVAHIGFRLYDATGELVAESDDPDVYPEGLIIRCSRGELLLEIPPDPAEHIQYRLYNCDGDLVTLSDGSRTKISALLRMEGERR